MCSTSPPRSISFSFFDQTTSGTNAYGVYPVPRASGAEAIVISASWVSRTDEGEGTPNMRGVATILALARFLTSGCALLLRPITLLNTRHTEYSLWAKDLIFVVNDGYMDGMQAWLSAYHGVSQASTLTRYLFGGPSEPILTVHTRRSGSAASETYIRCHLDRAMH